MFLSVVTGILGSVIHFIFDVGWVAQKHAGLHATELIRMALGGQAPPLAPGMLMQLGLLGLLYAWRHPVLNAGIVEEFVSITRR